MYTVLMRRHFEIVELLSFLSKVNHSNLEIHSYPLGYVQTFDLGWPFVPLLFLLINILQQLSLVCTWFWNLDILKMVKILSSFVVDPLLESNYSQACKHASTPQKNVETLLSLFRSDLHFVVLLSMCFVHDSENIDLLFPFVIYPPPNTQRALGSQETVYKTSAVQNITILNCL